jgi:hypothetical protein
VASNLSHVSDSPLMSLAHKVVKVVADRVANDIHAGAAPTLYCISEPIPPGSYVGVSGRFGPDRRTGADRPIGGRLRLRAGRAAGRVRRDGDRHDAAGLESRQIMSLRVSQRITGQPMKTGSQQVSTR